MGEYQAVQPLFGKVDIRPAMMVGATRATPSVLSTAEDTPQPTPYPAVQAGEGRAMAVFEILKPALQNALYPTAMERQGRCSLQLDSP